MSLLLDALKKADRERTSQHQPVGIGTQTTAEARATVTLRLLLAGLAALVLALIALVIWLVLEREEPAQMVMSEPQNTPVMGSELQPDTVTRAAPAEPESAAAKPVESELPDREPLNNTLDKKPLDTAPRPAAEPSMLREPNPPQIVEAEPEVKPAPEPRDFETAPNDEVAKLYRSAPKEQAAAPAADSGAPQPGSERQSGGQRLEDFPRVGGIRDLPLSAQNAIPSLMYAGHDYRLGGSSRVILNGQSWREGDTLPGDLVLEVIAEDGVLMRHGDHHFKLRALSSWVNM